LPQSQELIASSLVEIETRCSPLPIADCQFPIGLSRLLITRPTQHQNRTPKTNRQLEIGNRKSA
jgi:hypothetical protein